MATDEWKQENPKISGHIPKTLKDQLNQFIEEQKLSSVSEALRIILENHFKNYFSKPEFSTSSQTVENSLDKNFQLVLNSIEKRLKSLETSLESNSVKISKTENLLKSQEKSSEVLNSVDNLKPESSQPVFNHSQRTIFDGWLTTGEAYTQLQLRGYMKSQVTLRRTLAKGQIPKELEELGLIADFNVRNQANRKDNSVRWLKIK